MKKSLKALILSVTVILLTMLMGISCTQEGVNSKAENSTGSSTDSNQTSPESETTSDGAYATIVLPSGIKIKSKDSSKEVSASYDDEISYLRYRAWTEGKDAKELTKTVDITGNSVKIGPFDEGSWYFSIELLNEKEHVVYSGQTAASTDLRAGRDPQIDITVRIPNGIGTGSIYIEIETNDTEGLVAITYSKAEYDKVNTEVIQLTDSQYEKSDTLENGNVKYTARIENIASGAYNINITMPNGVSYQKGVMVISDEETHITGQMLTSQTSEEDIRILISITVSTVPDLSGSIKLSEDGTYYYWDSQIEDCTYEWSRDGQVLESKEDGTVLVSVVNTASDGTEYEGTKELTCIVKTKDGRAAVSGEYLVIEKTE